MTTENRYLIKRNVTWHYFQRIPTPFRKYDKRSHVKKSLRTGAIALARERRDALEKANLDYWASLAAIDLQDASSPNGCDDLRAVIERRYEASCIQAISISSRSNPLESVLRDLALSKLLDRLEVIAKPDGPAPYWVSTHERNFGGGFHAPPPATLTQAFEIYYEKIAAHSLVHKSKQQRHEWRAAKLRSINRLADIVGDKPIDEVTREDGLKFYGWLLERIRPRKGRKHVSASAANNDLGNVRRLYREYYEYFGYEDRPNPFRKLSFKSLNVSEVPPFTDEWVQGKLLQPQALNHLPPEARSLIYVLIETGCRTSEIINLTQQDIILDTDVPFIKVRPHRGREIKTPASMRDIPLVGVALEAMRRAPRGFPKLRKSSDRLSGYLLKSLRRNDLMPTQNHVIYSFRHSFEKRMLEAGLDYGLRCRLMGHATDRPDYGGGGSMSFRRDELLKIAHPFPEGLFNS
ncbi:MAG: site-specific integrase [Pseudomonadota bacterium]